MDSSDDAILRRLRDQTRAVERASRFLTHDEAELRQVIHDASRAGVEAFMIAQMTGLSEEQAVSIASSWPSPPGDNRRDTRRSTPLPEATSTPTPREGQHVAG